jgi:Flp pilus assembly protein TadD
MNAVVIKERLVNVESTSRARPQQSPSLPRSDLALETSTQLPATVRPSQHDAKDQQPVSQKPPLATTNPKPALSNLNGDVAAAHAQTRTLGNEESVSPLSASVRVSGTEAPPITRVLTLHASNTIRYDMERAKEALRERRYDNAIWHLQRVVALDPDNQPARDLLASAYKARAF